MKPSVLVFKKNIFENFDMKFSSINLLLENFQQSTKNPIFNPKKIFKILIFFNFSKEILWKKKDFFGKINVIKIKLVEKKSKKLRFNSRL
mmetsp:Transcript_67032/g.165337  ORF Transcript_67032/g.165337 Transcript_67032/m.165337 type:complete len:90 (+) Transcript_67032:1520-1789(+)